MDMSNIATSSKPNRKHFDVISSELVSQDVSLAERRQLELSQQLCRSMNPKELMDIFFQAIRADITYDSVEYHHKQLSISLTFGRSQRHRLDYHLTMSGNEMGTLIFTRSRVFTAQEIREIENLIGALMLPLRNATMYQIALDSAFEDPLTGVRNRASLDKELPREISYAQRHGDPLTVLVVDIDHFKSVNDNHGHQVGDRVLCEVAEIMKDCIRGTDLLYRYGGDEFVIALRHTKLSDAMDVAERIRQRVERGAFLSGNVCMVVSASIGVAEVHERDSVDSIFLRADRAMLDSKRGGRNRVLAT